MGSSAKLEEYVMKTGLCDKSRDSRGLSKPLDWVMLPQSNFVDKKKNDQILQV